jgi:hypothetical protein
MKKLDDALNSFSQMDKTGVQEKKELRKRCKNEEERISTQERVEKYMANNVNDV